MHSQNNRGRLIVYGLLLLLAASMLFPFYWMAITSLKGKADVFSTEPKLLPGRQLAERVVDDPRWFFHSGTTNYSQLLDWQRQAGSGAGGGPRGFSRFVLNTVFFALAITLGQVITSSLAAFAFARLQFPGRNSVFFAYLATLMIPATVTMIPSYILLRELGWVDTYQAVILPAVFTAYGTFMLRQFFLTIPREIEDAARIDGCSPLGLYWRIPDLEASVPLPDRLLPNQVGAAPLNRFGEWGPWQAAADRTLLLRRPRPGSPPAAQWLRFKGFVCKGHGPGTGKKDSWIVTSPDGLTWNDPGGVLWHPNYGSDPAVCAFWNRYPRQLRAVHPSQERRPAHRPDGNPGLEGVFQGRAGLVPRRAGSRPGRALRDARLPLRQPVHRIALGLPDPATADLPARQVSWEGGSTASWPTAMTVGTSSGGPGNRCWPMPIQAGSGRGASCPAA